MRDLLLTAIIVGSLPLILMRPYIGSLMWAWLAYMNPHRFTFGFAYDFPFAQLVAGATLIGLLTTRDRSGIPLTAVTGLWITFVIWMSVTTVFAIDINASLWEWERTIKIQLMSFVTIMLIVSRRQIDYLVWVVALSVAFFGVKGGIFGLVTGAEYGISGPMDSFFEDNNALGLALVMILPLLRYLQLSSRDKRIRIGLIAAMLLCALAVLATHSRGALLAAAVMMLVLIWHSRGKGWLLLAAAVSIPLMWTFMPQSWHERMGTISEYQQDASALGRINAWHFAFNLAKDRPLTGGGFDTFTPELFTRYAPNPEDVHDSHSIYFEVLGEHGFVGLGLFLLLGLYTLRTATRIRKKVEAAPEDTRERLRWAADLAAMLRVSAIGYAVGGMFLGLAYFDLYYHVVAMVVVLDRRMAADAATLESAAPVTVPSYSPTRPHRA